MPIIEQLNQPTMFTVEYHVEDLKVALAVSGIIKKRGNYSTRKLTVKLSPF